MSEKKRKPKRPKAMQAKPRVTTEATKHKLPKPRNRPASLNRAVLDAIHGYTPSPIAGQPLDGICSAPAPEFRAIPCGEDWDAQDHRPTCPEAQAYTGKPCGCGEDGPGMMWHVSPDIFERFKVREYAEMYQERMANLVGEQGNFYGIHIPPPDTQPYPWPLRFVNWVDDKLAAAQRWLATRLRRLADAVEGTP